MLTIPLRIPSTSASEASLKETSQTLIIFCKSSSKPISLLRLREFLTECE